MAVAIPDPIKNKSFVRVPVEKLCISFTPKYAKKRKANGKINKVSNSKPRIESTFISFFDNP